MPPKTKHPVLVLTQAGDVNPATIQTAGPLTLQAIQTFLKKKKGIDILGTYKAKQIVLTLFGAAEGAEEDQNQHQLPPPHDADSFYGDIVVVASKAGEEGSYEKPVAFKPEEYEEFYTKMFDGGYDSDEGGPEGTGEEAFAEADVDADLDAIAEDEDAEAEEGKEFEEEEDEEEDEEAAEAADEADEDAPVAAPKPKAKKKKAVAKTGAAAALAGTGSAYASPPILSETEQLQEEESAAEPLPVPRQRICTSLGQMFHDILSEEAVITMERCIYNGAIKQARTRHIVRSWEYPLFVHIYKMHAMHITSNFHPASYVKNTELYESFQKGEISFEAMASMNNYELFPSHWREMFEQRQIREKKQLEGNRDRATDQFTCTRCWKKECTYYEMQTRSADEPMTIFITCLNCGKKWRQ